MKTKLIAQEILITHTSTLFNTQFDERSKGHIEQSKNQEILADACWQGLLYEVVPEICTTLFLREINETDYFLELKYGSFNDLFEKKFSINPYLFFQNKSEN